MLLAAQHMGDPLLHVVDHVGQQEQHRAVRPGQHEVLDRRVLEHRLAADQVIDHGRALVRRAEPERPSSTGPEGAVPAEAVVAAVLITGPGDHVLALAIAVVSHALGVQPLGGLGVLDQVRRLKVRALVLAAVDPEPAPSR